MRLAFILLVVFHGVIHLFGFLKAFEFAEMKALTQSISKPLGILWFLVFLIFLLAIILLLFENNYWWLVGIIAVVLSQILIVKFWQDAKYGTIANVIILLVCLVGGANSAFKKMVNKEVAQMHSNIMPQDKAVISNEMIAHLPVPVNNWMTNSGILGQSLINSMHMKQDVLMKLNQEQKKWYKGKVEQFTTTQPPVFNWQVDLKMNPFMTVSGRDKFEDGKGAMLIKAYSIFPVVDVKENDKVNEAALQRYLAELAWYPSGALSKYISWEEIDDFSAKATMVYQGTSGSGVFHFSSNGDVIGFSTKRYMGMDENATLEEWIIEMYEHKVMDGIRIPQESKVLWELENGNWEWLKIKVTEVKYKR